MKNFNISFKIHRKIPVASTIVVLAVTSMILGALLPSVTATTAGSPYDIAVNLKTNMVYVTNGGSAIGKIPANTVSVINGATNTVTATIAVGILPKGIDVNSKTNTIYVANNGPNTVSVIDGATKLVTTTITVRLPRYGVRVNKKPHAS